MRQSMRRSPAFRRVMFGWFLVLAVLPAPGCAKEAGVNPGVVEIDYPGNYARVMAVSDVHGMYKALIALLRSGGVIDKTSRWTAGRTLLIVAGDSIDKGPDGVETLDLWASLARQAPRHGGRVIHLLGNHEAEFLADPKGNKKSWAFQEELEAKGISLREMTRPGHPRADFLLAMPAAARVGKWLFCHAGLLPDKSWADFTEKAAEVLSAGDYGNKFFSANDSFLQDKDWWETAAGRMKLEKRLSQNGLFGVVFGHQNKAFDAPGRIAVSADYRLIKIDAGLSPEHGSPAGSLLIFPRPAEMGRAARAAVQFLPSGGTAQPLVPR